MKIALSAIAVSVLLVAACGDAEIKSSQVEEYKLISKNNALQNAKRWSSEVHKKDLNPVAQSDSTITKACPFGDGFATVEVTIDNQLRKLQCQTNGQSVGVQGCLTEADFASKPVYANGRGQCNKDIDSLEKF